MTTLPWELEGYDNNWLHKGYYTAPGQPPTTNYWDIFCHKEEVGSILVRKSLYYSSVSVGCTWYAWMCILCYKPFTVRWGTQILQLKVHILNHYYHPCCSNASNPEVWCALLPLGYLSALPISLPNCIISLVVYIDHFPEVNISICPHYDHVKSHHSAESALMKDVGACVILPYAIGGLSLMCSFLPKQCKLGYTSTGIVHLNGKNSGNVRFGHGNLKAWW